jgi:hypothetical protein
MKWILLSIALLLGPLSPAFAHGGGPHLKGTVSAISTEQITVEAEGGKPASAKITPETRFVRGNAEGKREDLKRGDRVVVHTRKHGDALEALEIRYK